MNVVLENLTTTQANLIAMLFEDNMLTDFINGEISSRNLGSAVQEFSCPQVDYSKNGLQHVIVF